jgi:hypothetical protein
MSLVSSAYIDAIKTRRWYGFPVIFGILLIVTSFQVLFQLHQSVKFLQQGLADDALISDTIYLSSITTKKSSKAAGNLEEENMQYAATVKEEEVFTRPDQSPATPNFFEILKKKDCVPDGIKCLNCLAGKRGTESGNCGICLELCGCFCDALCREKVESKFVSKQLTVTLPSQTRDSDRLIPRIIHQTWFKEIEPKKYPNKSRLVQSFRLSGWEHRFYTDEESASFLSTHFPPEVREAYDALLPGAFKADLFRYCALLIYGGLYADVDILLESNLDFSVGPDVGFMVPFDNVSLQLCLFRYEWYYAFFCSFFLFSHL